MTIATTSNKVIGQGNAATTNWPFSFLIPDQASLVVLYTDTAGLISTIPAGQYSVAGLNDPNGGSVTYPLSGAPIAVGTTLTVLRTVAYNQQRSVINQSGFFPDVYEAALDYLTMQTQQINEILGRAIVASSGDLNPVMGLPAAVARANSVLGFDAAGNVAILNKNTNVPTFSPSTWVLTNVAAMKGLTGIQNGVVVQTRGYTTQGDGGAATYFFNAADARADNSGTILAPSGGGAGRWNLMPANVVWVEQFGAVGNGVTNDTVAIQAAIDFIATTGGTVNFSAKSYLVTSLVQKPGVYLVGQGGMKRTVGAVYGTRLLGTAGSDIITFPDANVSDMAVVGIKLSGGRRSISYAPTGATFITEWHLEDLDFDHPSAECIYVGGQSERQLFKFLSFDGGTYGYYHGKGAFPAFGIFEKSTWEHLYFEGQSKSGVFFDTIGNSGSSTFNFVKVISCGENAWRFKGNFSGLVLIDLMFEACCTTGKSSNTTGGITAGLTALVVADATGLAQGDPITIRGAGASGADLITTISLIAGVNVTTADAAGTTVVAELVTNRGFDLMSFELAAGTGNAGGITFIGGILQDATVSKARYALNNAGGWVQDGTLVGVGGSVGGAAGTPVYDPNRRLCAINSNIGVRVAYTGVRPSFERGEISTLSNGRAASTGEAPPTIIGTPRGKGAQVYLLDSAGNGTGTLGSFEVYASNATPTRYLLIDPTNGLAAVRLKLAAGNFGGGTGATILEGSCGTVFGQAAPTAGAWIQGDTVWKSNATVGQPIGWRCTVSGTPGTWVAMANL